MYLGMTLSLLFLAQFAVAAAKDNKTFKATKEWKEIKNGQGISAGLHVRINLQTGKKAAKLLDESEDDERTNAGLPNVVIKGVPKTNFRATAKSTLKISKTLSETLKNIPKDSLGIGYSPEKLEQIKRDFKTYNELTESFKDLQNEFQTDTELITKLINKYTNLRKQEFSLTLEDQINTQLHILEDLDYLVHQIDNALWFIDKGGFEQILLPLFVNDTNMNLRIKAIRLLGAVIHNNPKAQIKAFERNFGSHLSQILISSKISEELSSALYAFGSLLRKFPLALQKILSASGTQALIAVLAKDCELKVKAKAITFISDIIVEKRIVLSNLENSDNLRAAAQYADLNLPEWLQSNSFCETVDQLVSTKLYELLDQPDLAEYFIEGLENSKDICKSIWSKSPQLRHTLLTMKNRYIYSQNEFQIEIAQFINRLLEILYSTNDHDEL
ncbi:nucleotide exchange factor Sil1 [Rhagoletis pomonella]|uniref:nucleotide exchange factor Sil1 n=1 Tax=Rhagoletis pomonella TaxID=28610 RepID=UPI00177D7283|nr:nucleotide exchange factor Sil1 [Rhagoletis pomonella]